MIEGMRTDRRTQEAAIRCCGGPERLGPQMMQPQARSKPTLPLVGGNCCWGSQAKSVIQKLSYKMLHQTEHATSSQPKQQQQSRKSLKRSPQTSVSPLVDFAMLVLAIYTSCQLMWTVAAAGVAPTIDYSHNMRVLKLPKSTKPGEIIYRLKGSDGDLNSQLHFGVLGISGRALLDIVQAPGSWKEADVYLRTRLDNAELTAASNSLGSIGDSLLSNENLQDDNNLSQRLYTAVFNLTIYVADATNKTTQVDSTILITNDDHLLTDDGPAAAADDAGQPLDGIGPSSSYDTGNNSANDSTEQQHYQLQASSTNYHSHQANGSALMLKLPTLPTMTRVNSNGQLSPFIRPRHVFSVPENGQPGESIGFVTVRESDKSDLPVRFELRGRGSEHFGIRYVFGPRGQSRAELVLSQPVDYEKQNLFQLKVLALNAWTNVKYDTRNVATLDIVIAVGDVQDTPPKFKSLPHSLRLTNNMRPGDLVGRIEAEDGDYADQRPIGYALDAGSPLSSYFNIDKLSGEIKLLRPLQELSLNRHSLGNDPAATSGSAGGGSFLQLTVYASELPDSTSYDHLWPPMFARAELPLQLVDSNNEPPQFIGGWIMETSNSGSALTVPTLRAFVREFSNERSDRGGNEEATLSRGDSAEVSSSSFDGSPGPQLVQWYTSKNHSATAAGLIDLGGSMAQDSTLALQQQLLKASRGRPMVVDFGQGTNGTFELALEGPDAHLFELEPSYPVNKQTLFNLFVAASANRSLFDFDATGSQSGGGGGSGSTRTTNGEPPARAFHVELVARDFGSPHRQTSRLKCLIDLVDINDNAPQFDLDLYTFSIFENAQLGQILGSIRARDMDRLAGVAGVLSGQYQRVRYTALSGRDSHLFRLDQESGLITLEGPLDREKQDHYLLLAEARDMSGQAANYTKILVNVLDVNDNAPVFSQSHYDAVLLADGTFYQPLVVSAIDADEPSSANSQVAYEIIAGNQNEQFAIDSLSGAIYPTGGDSQSSLATTRPIQIPSILSEPILPFIGTRDQQHKSHNNKPDQHGKILPSPNAHGHEIEETTVPTGHQRQPNSPLRLNWPRSVPIGGSINAPEVVRSAVVKSNTQDAYSSFDPLMQLENYQDRHLRAATGTTTVAQPTTNTQSAGGHQVVPKQASQTAQSQRGFHTNDRDLRDQLNPHHHHQHFDASKVPPVTTLVVRAHDFGIPLRSATCKVNIYNQALLSRSLSVILNGTAEQLEQRRELIERSFGALTGSRAQIESIDALTDSSSISVARLKLAIPSGHSLIDLTDLSALMTAIDYKLPAASNCPTQQQQQQQQQQNLEQFRHPVHYITTGDRIYPIHHASISNNISATAPPPGGGTNGGTTTAIFTDVQSFDHANSMLERKLLFYIIIVGICILALLVIWMIYFCCREDQRDKQQKRTKKLEAAGQTSSKRHHRSGLQSGSVGDSELSRDSAASGTGKGVLQKGARHYKNKTTTSSSRTHLIDEQQPMARSASQINLADQERGQAGAKSTQAKTTMTEHPIGQNLLKQQQSKQLSIPSNIKPEHYSMYNGQVWFEQGGLLRNGQTNGTGGGGVLTSQRGLTGISERRASSAPSAGGHSLDSSLHAIIQGHGRSSAFSPANSGLATPQRGQFFPNTLGYAENLATIATPAAYIYPTTGTSSGPRQRQFLSRRTLAKSRGRVMPMAMVGGGSGRVRDYTNDAFEPDLESGPGGQLVMVPFVAGSTAQRRHSHSREKRRHGHTKSKSQSTSSSSRSDSTRTLDEEDELDHESVLLDSDQELLGFDSTGTPIIATRTRHKPRTEPSLLLAPETSALTSLATGASSPAATVINMDQSKEPPQNVQKATSGSQAVKNSEKHDSGGDKEGLKSASEAGQLAASSGPKSKQVAAGQDQPKPDEDATEQTRSDAKRSADDKGMPSGSNKDTRTTKTEDSTARKSMDLMSELNERLSSANKQRALRRQSADDESKHQPSKQVTGQTVTGDKPAASVDVSEGTKGERSSGAPSDKKLTVSLGDSNKEQVSSAAAKPTIAATGTTTNGEDTADSKRRQAFAGRRASETMSCLSQSTISDATTTTGDRDNRLEGMKNAELLEKQSIFALTYSGLATDKPPG